MQFFGSDGSLDHEIDLAGKTVINHRDGTSRPFTAEEEAAYAEQAARDATRAIQVELQAGLENVIARALDYQAQAQAILDDTNNNINSNPAQRIKTLARAQKRSAGDIIRLARLAGQMYDSADTGNAD